MKILTTTAVLLALSGTALAGAPGRFGPKPAPNPVRPPAVVLPAPQGDPFGAWLNGVRARYGLPGVTASADMVAVSAANSQAQLSRGMGHFVMGTATRQNAGMGPLPQVAALWLADPPHLAAIIDPRVRFYGIAGAGAYWTLSLR